MTRQERNAAIFLILLGVAVDLYTLAKLQLGTLQEPGPGFFPFICGTGIVFLAGFWLLTNLKAIACYQPLWQKGELIGPVLGIGLVSVYAAMLEELGYLLATLVFMLAWQKIIEREKWLRTGVIGVIGTLVMFALFSYLLGVPLPEGMFSE